MEKRLGCEEAARLAEKALRERDKKLTGCVSYVQRTYQWGYNYTASAFECLVEQGVISEPDKNGERHWLKNSLLAKAVR